MLLDPSPLPPYLTDMAVRPILTAPDPRLKAVSTAVEKVDGDIRKLAEDMARAAAGHETKIKSLHEDFAKQAAASNEEHGRSLAEKETLLSRKLQAGEQERANLIQQKDATIAKLVSDIEAYKKQIETLNKERDSHRDSQSAARLPRPAYKSGRCPAPLCRTR